jgi:rare lipoprotein A
MRPFLFLLAALACIAPARAETGLASWYGSFEEGRPMASGKPFHAMGNNAASRTYPLGTHLLITNMMNGRHAEVVIEDRGPYVKPRILDVSRGTARILGFETQGVTMVQIETAGVVVRPAVYLYRTKLQPQHAVQPHHTEQVHHGKH